MSAGVFEVGIPSWREICAVWSLEEYIRTEIGDDDDAAAAMLVIQGSVRRRCFGKFSDDDEGCSARRMMTILGCVFPQSSDETLHGHPQ